LSNFETMVQGSAWSALAAHFGRTVTYSPHEGQEKSITAIWNPNRTLPEYYPDGEQKVARGVLRVNPADVPNPDERDSFTIDDVVWPVVVIGRRTPILELQLETRQLRTIGPGDSGRVKR